MMIIQDPSSMRVIPLNHKVALMHQNVEKIPGWLTLSYFRERTRVHGLFPKIRPIFQNTFLA